MVYRSTLLTAVGSVVNVLKAERRERLQRLDTRCGYSLRACIDEVSSCAYDKVVSEHNMYLIVSTYEIPIKV